MDYKDVLAFAKENPACFIATIDGDQPRVRGFLTVLFEDNNIYFTTASTKNVYKQLITNPRIEFCYHSSDFRKQMRITGEIEIVNDLQKKQRLLDEREYLRMFGGKADDSRFILLGLPHGRARFWTLADNMRENEAEVIEF